MRNLADGRLSPQWDDGMDGFDWLQLLLSAGSFIVTLISLFNK